MRRPLFAPSARALPILVAVLAFAVASTAFAQTDVTTSRISGTAKDAEGGALPGVSIEGKNQDTGLVANATTNQQGFYQLVNLPTGNYTIIATLSGFKTAATENVRLLLGTSPSVNFTLQLEGVAEAITVTGEVRVVEVTNTAASTTIQTEEIKKLPSGGRDFKLLVVQTPQVRFDSERGNLAIAGERGINTNVAVDGVDFNNAMFGGTVGGAEGRAPLSLSQESIKEISVITNGASVEFGRTGGGVVNVITKSGTNRIHGSAFYYYQPQEWISNFATAFGSPVEREPAEQDKTQFGASLGGPIMKDRLFFFASYDQQDRNETVPIQASTLSPAVFARYPELASPDTYVQTQDGDVLFGRLDFQLGSAHRFMVRGNFTDYEGINGTSSSQTRTESFNGLEGLDTDAWVGSWSGQFTSNLLNDLNLNWIKEDTPREDKGLNLVEVQVGSNRYGEVSFLPILTTTERKAIGDTVTFLFREHVIKGGAEYNENSLDQVFKGNWRGVFIFADEASLLAGRWREYRQFGGLGGRTSDEGGAASLEQKELAFFAQDQWFVTPNLTVTAGLRWEGLDNPDQPILNPNDQNADGSFRLTGEIPDEDKQWSPRLGISWALDSKTVVRLTAGRYWSRTPMLLWVQPITSNGYQATQYIIGPLASGLDPTNPNCACYDPLAPTWGLAWSPVGVERIDFTRVTAPPRPGVFYVDPDFRNPRTDRVTLGFEREIVARTAASFEMTYAEGKQLQRLTDINRVYDGTTARSGLPRYSSTRPFSYYGRITTSTSDAEAKYYAMALQFQRRFTDQFSVNAGLTWSKDRDNDSNERNFAGIQAEDFNDLDNNYGYSNRDQTWRGGVNAVWDTPFWGIGLSGSYAYSTGSAYTGRTNTDTDPTAPNLVGGNNDGESGTDRPTSVTGNHFDRNSFRQPDFHSLSLRLSKGFRIGPGELLGLIECFNCADSANRFVTQTIWGTNPAVPRSDFGQTAGVGTPRTFQVAARYDF